MLQASNTHTPYKSEFYDDIVHEGITKQTNKSTVFRASVTRPRLAKIGLGMEGSCIWQIATPSMNEHLGSV